MSSRNSAWTEWSYLVAFLQMLSTIGLLTWWEIIAKLISVDAPQLKWEHNLHESGYSGLETNFLEANNSSSCDNEGIKIKPVKHGTEVISSCQVHIFNFCIETAIFIPRMKVTNVAVLYKKNNKNNFGNCRPISILSKFSKDLESILHDRLVKLSKKYNILPASQYGYWKFVLRS